MDKALLPTGFCTDGLGAVPGMYRCSKPSPGPHSLEAALKLADPQILGNGLLFTSHQIICKGFASQLESVLLEIS